MAMASNGIVKSFNVFKNKFVSVLKILNFKAIEPFSFN